MKKTISLFAAMFQFLIGKVQHGRLLEEILYIEEKFQFLIGKVQLSKAELRVMCYLMTILVSIPHR